MHQILLLDLVSWVFKENKHVVTIETGSLFSSFMPVILFTIAKTSNVNHYGDVCLIPDFMEII
jgi:hypothetical protein